MPDDAVPDNRVPDNRVDPTAQPDTAGPGTAAAISYEAARDELAAVVAALEAGGQTLDESLALWERGEELARICSRFLDGARQRVEDALARADGDGTPRT